MKFVYHFPFAKCTSSFFGISAKFFILAVYLRLCSALENGRIFLRRLAHLPQHLRILGRFYVKPPVKDIHVSQAVADHFLPSLVSGHVTVSICRYIHLSNFVQLLGCIFFCQLVLNSINIHLANGDHIMPKLMPGDLLRCKPRMIHLNKNSVPGDNAAHTLIVDSHVAGDNRGRQGRV